MSEKKQVSKTSKPAETKVDTKKTKPTTDAKAVKDAADKLIDEIDEVIEEIGVEVVQKYVQRGGE